MYVLGIALIEKWFKATVVDLFDGGTLAYGIETFDVT